MQLSFELIPHKVGREIIQQRARDGYINATAMCKAANRLWGHYRENASTKAFLAELSVDIGIPMSDLIESIKGGEARLQGTWVHPQVAIHLAQWLSPGFAVKVSQWVYDWLSGKAPKARAQLPYHLCRYVANHQNVPVGHFSVLTEVTQTLIAPMEIMGYTMPERILPDISEGKMFCRWLRERKDIDTDALPTYVHVYEDGRRVKAKAYPETLLADFRRHFREEWLPNKAITYFRERDPDALTYLPKLLPGPEKLLS